jgi:hypothetical protein
MNMEKDYIKLIFGLSSSKHVRTKIFLLACQNHGMSKSYLNEIEKGKEVSQDR